MDEKKHNHNNGFSLSRTFNGLTTFAKENTLETIGVATSLAFGGLMMTTSIVPAMLTSAYAAPFILTGSLALLIYNGKTAVNSTLALGKKFGIPAMTLGAIIGSLNTIPEIMVSLQSVAQGAVELGVGNVVGSNVAHSLLILGATAAIAGIKKADDLSWKFNTYMMMGTAAIFGSQLMLGTFSPMAGVVMLGLGGYYIYDRLKGLTKKNTADQKEHSHDHDHSHEHSHDHDHAEGDVGSCLFHDHHGEEDDHKMNDKLPRTTNALLAGGGLLGLMVAADLIVASGVSLTHSPLVGSIASMFGYADFGLSQAAVGAVIVAAGTALPELSMGLNAIKEKHSDMALGNVLGCSIVNTLVAGGVICVGAFFSVPTMLGMAGAYIGSQYALNHLEKNGNKINFGLSDKFGRAVVNTVIAGGIIGAGGLISSMLSPDFTFSQLFLNDAVPNNFNTDSTSGIFNIGAFVGTAGLLGATLLATKGAISRIKGALALTAYGGYLLGATALSDGKAPIHHQHSSLDETTISQPAEIKPDQKIEPKTMEMV